MKKRNKHSKMEKRGLFKAAEACNELDLIWRDCPQEDVGVDATLEIVIDGFPTGKLVAVQMKAGSSYIRSASKESFRFYYDKDDLDYWQSLIIPLIVIFYDPKTDELYWFNVHHYLENQIPTTETLPYLEVHRLRKIDQDFVSHLKALFDLVSYSDAEYNLVVNEMLANQYVDNENGEPIIISSLDIFVAGLWGLCSKVQFHLSLLTEELREVLVKKRGEHLIKFDLSRGKLFPFLTGYFGSIQRHRLASLDINDLNETLYGKLEWPAFVVSLTTNGRRFIEYLRFHLSNRYQVCDHQHLTFRLFPHVQIEVYTDFRPGSPPMFGECTDVLIIRFNRYLDFYHVLHIERTALGRKVRIVCNQSIYYYELLDYLTHLFQGTPKNNVLHRIQDVSMSPLICWLEKYLDFEVGISAEDMACEPLAEQIARYDELQCILAPAGSEFTVEEIQMPITNYLTLLNGQLLFPKDKAISDGNVDASETASD